MKKINMVDLAGQYNSIQNQVNKAIKDVINSTSFINGPSVLSFQNNLEKYLNVRNVIPCANGTDALQISLMSLDLKPGDEVITVDFTFASTVEVISLLNLTPVLVDVDIDSFNINIDSLESAITKKTKVIIPVHLFGQAANMEKIILLAKKYNINVIEDAAQALGANFKFSNGKKQKVGTIGRIGTTSFFPSKNLGAYGDGGAIFTNDDELAKKIRGIVNHGMYKRYHHDIVGVNSRLDSIQAAILDVKLKFLDEYNNSRKIAASKYSELLIKNNNIKIPKVIGDEDSHVFHQYTISLNFKKRDELAKYFTSNNIPYGIYYPIPLHKQKAYQNDRFNDEDFKNTNKLCNSVISLPMHTELNDDQINFICNKIITFLK
ncbi:MAG: transcriptional regulator [Flavobacteriaceae bacterium]|jgi:UDP-2-acetamido-2-deoxy-ribo-hexuluronate aminotransferase|nr:transcriptional regulator [Flavobacteriaceae bacterium]|tara:strand:+ start:529 stop:1659 length:1131 start_codon:yes stop_codon:yes gene_type:complete